MHQVVRGWWPGQGSQRFIGHLVLRQKPTTLKASAADARCVFELVLIFFSSRLPSDTRLFPVPLAFLLRTLSKYSFCQGLIKARCTACYSSKENLRMAGLCKTCSGNYRGSHCNDCKNNAYEINGICELKREPGSSCAESYQCTSAKCPRSQSAGHCCASNVVTQAGSPHQCLACDARGACTSCAQHHLWSGALCKTKVPQPGGAVCEVDSDCSSGQCGHSAPGELGHCCSRRINHCSYCGKNGECKQCDQGWTFDFGAQKCMSDCTSVAAPVPHSVKHGHWGKPYLRYKSPHVTGHGSCESQSQHLQCLNGKMTNCEAVGSSACESEYASCKSDATTSCRRQTHTHTI